MFPTDDYQNDLESSVHGADIIKDDSISSVFATEIMEMIYNHSVVVFRGGQEPRPKARLLMSRASQR